MDKRKQLDALHAFAKMAKARRSEDYEAIQKISNKHPNIYAELGVTDSAFKKAVNKHKEALAIARTNEDTDDLCAVECLIAKDTLLFAGFTEKELEEAGLVLCRQ